MGETKTENSYQTVFVIDGAKYTVWLNLLVNGTITINAEEQITKIQYGATKSDDEILELTCKATYEMRSKDFFELIVDGFDKSDDDLTIKGNIAGKLMILTIHLNTKVRKHNMKKTFAIVLNEIEQQDIDRMGKMLHEFNRKYAGEDLGEIINKTRLNEEKVNELEICVNDLKSMLVGDIVPTTKSNEEKVNELRISINNLASNETQLFEFISETETKLEQLQISDSQIIQRVETTETKLEQLQSLETQTAQRITATEAKIEQLQSLETQTAQRITATEAKIEQLQSLETQTAQRILAIETLGTQTAQRIAGTETKLDTEIQHRIADINRLRPIITIWKSSTRCTPFVKISINITKCHSNSDLIISGNLSVFGNGLGCQFWKLGESSYTGGVHQFNDTENQLHSLPLGAIISNNTTTGQQTLELTFTSIPFVTLNPDTNDSISLGTLQSQSYIRIEEIIIQ